MKKILVTRSSMPPLEEYVDEIKILWESHWLTNMGEKHQELEKLLTQYLKVPYVSLFSNGHMALELLLQALKLQGEVITTPFTFASTTHAIVRNGLKPVYCDITLKDYTIDVSQIEDLITEKTCAIVPVHVYGHVCDVREISRLAKKYNLKVIYDAAHAFGVEYDGHGIGEYGDASMFSFHATKVFNTIEGGAVAYKEQRLENELWGLKNFGIKDEENIDKIGANAKLNELQAAMGICNLRHLAEEIRKREVCDTKYRENLSDIEGIYICDKQENVKYNYSYFPVLFDKSKIGVNRNEVYSLLKDKGIFTRKYFYPLTSNFECYQNLPKNDKTPVAQYVSDNILVLPLYADLSSEDIDYICDEIKTIIKKG